VHFLSFLNKTSKEVVARRGNITISAVKQQRLGISSPHIHSTSMAPSQNFRAALAEAEKGNTEAQVFVQHCYYFGDEGVTKEPALSFKFCLMAAEGGNTKCQRDLGVMYSQGVGVERDQRKASAWYLRAAKEGGHAEAQYQTAQRYQDGRGHDAPNMKDAIEWYQAAAFQGHCVAQLNVGACYEKGDGVYTNPGLALKLYRKCAKHIPGDAEDYVVVALAHNNIGNCYCNGSNEVEVDLPMAMQWCTKSAELGCVAAQRVIGEIYLMGFFREHVPVGTFDRDVPLGMKHLRALTVADKTNLRGNEAEAISEADALILDFHVEKSCMGCGSPKARKLCSGCLYHADHTKVRYCGEACQLIHWRHQTASHKAECGSRAATRDGTGAA
jgi:TPR repeat protein